MELLLIFIVIGIIKIIDDINNSLWLYCSSSSYDVIFIL